MLYTYGEDIMKRREELPDCPVATTVALVGSKWKLLILRNLIERPWRFNELQKSIDGIITRTVYPEVPPRVEYALSDLGHKMRPILSAMEDFGTFYKAELAAQEDEETSQDS